jgi:endonuclease YncB( thermonuclease family)
MRRAMKIILLLAAALALLPFLRISPETPVVSKTVEAPPAGKVIEEARIQELIRRDIRNVTPPGMLQAPKLEGTTIVREPAKVLPKPPPRPPKPDLYARPTVEAAGMMRSGETSIRIAGIRPVGAEEICSGSDGRQWPCGIHARTALQRLIRQRTITCDPGGVRDDGGALARHCKVGSIDIGQWLVEQGWALPQGRNDLSETLKAAKDAKRGQWGDAPD